MKVLQELFPQQAGENEADVDVQLSGDGVYIVGAAARLPNAAFSQCVHHGRPPRRGVPQQRHTESDVRHRAAGCKFP